MNNDKTNILDDQHPWPGMMSFDESCSEYFHGRENEVKELHRLVRRNMLTTLFGRSGLGKSSLLKAGLFPNLREQDYLPIYIRLDVADSPIPLIEQVNAAIKAAFDDNQIEAEPPRAEETLWEYFHREDIDFWMSNHHLAVPVLVFDQFEEIFTLLPRDKETNGHDQRMDLVTALAELIENRPPASVVRKLEADPEQSSKYDFSKKSCNIIFTFREDYLGHFEELRKLIPSIMTNRLRLTCMDGPRAFKAIIDSGGHLLEDEVAERIIKFVACGEDCVQGDDIDLESLEVEPALLSVICRELNNKRIDSGQEQITKNLLEGHHDSIITDFYEENISDMPPDCRIFIEDLLLTDSGHRDSCALETILAKPGVTRGDIDKLVTRRLLRLEERFGVVRVELTHDLLTTVIRESRDSRRAQIQLEEQKRLEKKRRRQMAAVGLGLLVISVILCSTTYFFYQLARRNDQDRERLLGYLTALTTEISDHIRLYPGSANFTRYLVEDVERFASVWEQESGEEVEAVDRLKANSLILQSNSAMLHGQPKQAQHLIKEAAQAIERIEQADGKSDEWLLWLKIDLLLQRGSIYNHLRLRNEAAKDYRRASELIGKMEIEGNRHQRRYARTLGMLGGSILRNVPEEETPSQQKTRLKQAEIILTEYENKIKEMRAYWEREVAIRNEQEHSAAVALREWVLWSREMSRMHGRWALYYKTLGQMDKVEQEYWVRIRNASEMLSKDPFYARIIHAYSSYRLAEILIDSGRAVEAEGLLVVAEKTARNLAELDSEIAYWPNMHARFIMSMGDARKALGDTAGALEKYRKAESTLRKQQEKFPDFTRNKSVLDDINARIKDLQAAN